MKAFTALLDAGHAPGLSRGWRRISGGRIFCPRLLTGSVRCGRRPGAAGPNCWWRTYGFRRPWPHCCRWTGCSRRILRTEVWTCWLLSPLSLEAAAAAKILAHWITTGLPLVSAFARAGSAAQSPTAGLWRADRFACDRDTCAFGSRRDRRRADPFYPPRRSHSCPDCSASDHPGADFRRGRSGRRPRGNRTRGLSVSRGLFGCRRGLVSLCLGRRGQAQCWRLIFFTPGRPYESTMITALANPKRFLDLSRIRRSLDVCSGGHSARRGFYWSLFRHASDYQQGQSVKIMFVHVPAAWMGIFVYCVMAGASLVGLVFRHPLADVAPKSAAPLGAAFTALALLTGSLWGRPMWGTYWQWGDARLVSELILLFIYLGYIALWNAIDDPVRAAKAAAILSLVGAADVPVIHFSVDWWNTLHQPASILRPGRPDHRQVVPGAASDHDPWLHVPVSLALAAAHADRDTRTQGALADDGQRRVRMASFFAMGGYAVFVWPAYAVTFVVLISCRRSFAAGARAGERKACASLKRRVWNGGSHGETAASTLSRSRSSPVSLSCSISGCSRARLRNCLLRWLESLRLISIFRRWMRRHSSSRVPNSATGAPSSSISGHPGAHRAGSSTRRCRSWLREKELRCTESIIRTNRRAPAPSSTSWAILSAKSIRIRKVGYQSIGV